MGDILIGIGLVLVILLVIVGANYAIRQRAEARSGTLDDAISDNEDPVPSTHIFPDDGEALGDTPEAHDEISPHDLPVDHPGRQAAEEQAGHEHGTTGGHADPSQAGSSS